MLGLATLSTLFCRTNSKPTSIGTDSGGSPSSVHRTSKSPTATSSLGEVPPESR
jgi:hypothetical protein